MDERDNSAAVLADVLAELRRVVGVCRDGVRQLEAVDGQTSHQLRATYTQIGDHLERIVQAAGGEVR